MYRTFVSHPLPCTGPLLLPCRTGLAGRVWNILEHLRYFFLSIRDVRSYVRTLYIVIHIFSKIILLLFSWTLEEGKGSLNPKKAYHRRIHNLEIVTVHRRSDSKRAYRSQAFKKN